LQIWIKGGKSGKLIFGKILNIGGTLHDFYLD